MCEIAGGAALIADPHSVEAIADRLRQVLTSDVAASLVKKGRERRRAFSSSVIARQHVDSYERARGAVSRRASARPATLNGLLKDQHAKSRSR